MEYIEDKFDSDEDLRRKRDISQSGSDYPEIYSDISNIGEFMYPEVFGLSTKNKEDQKISSVGAFLYPHIYETNNISEVVNDSQDYLIQPIKADIYDENEVPIKSTNNHMDSLENVSIYNKIL